MILSSNLQALLFIVGLVLIVGGTVFALAVHTGLIMADPEESPTTNKGTSHGRGQHSHPHRQRDA
jgi:hypothetical protein